MHREAYDIISEERGIQKRREIQSWEKRVRKRTVSTFCHGVYIIITTIIKIMIMIIITTTEIMMEMTLIRVQRAQERDK